MDAIAVRAARAEDRTAIDRFLAANHAAAVARRGELVDATRAEALVAEVAGRLAGVATLVRHGDEIELLTLHAVERGHGVGTALLAAAAEVARAQGCRRLWLITTNDNLDALRFYQRRGLRLAALHAGAVDQSRATRKPSIPDVGEHGIPIRDELELELRLG